MSKVVAELKYSAAHERVAADVSGPVGIGFSAVAAEGPLLPAGEYAAANGGEL